MRLTEILTVDRILVDPSGALVGDKSKVLTELARLLSAGSSADSDRDRTPADGT